jgi:hypothetical protein
MIAWTFSLWAVWGRMRRIFPDGPRHRVTPMPTIPVSPLPPVHPTNKTGRPPVARKVKRVFLELP